MDSVFISPFLAYLLSVRSRQNVWNKLFSNCKVMSLFCSNVSLCDDCFLNRQSFRVTSCETFRHYCVLKNYLLIFVQQEIQNTVQDDVIHYKTSSIPDSYQLKASRTPTQCDNQKERKKKECPQSSKTALMIQVKFIISHNYTLDVST